MLESKIQEKIIKFLAASGCLAVKLVASKRGWPDILAISPGGQVVFLEVKTSHGRLSSHQLRVHEQLQEHHCHVYTVTSIEDTERALAGIK